MYGKAMEANVYVEAGILVAVSGALILAIKAMGGYEQVEQFLYENDRSKYYVMKACYMLLLITLTINIRYAFTQVFKELST